MDRKRPGKNSIFDKWFRYTALVSLGLVLLFVGLNILVDPYFHYHKPVTKYRLNDERYINDGIARNFDYDTIIIGNSLFQNFKTSQYDELNGTKSIKLPYSGAGIQELWLALGRIVGRDGITVDLLGFDPKEGAQNLGLYAPCKGYRDDVKEVIMCTDMEDVMRGYAWHRYNEYPDYLYDDDLINDTQYILNKDSFYRGTFYDLVMTLTGRESTSFDDYSSWVRESGPKAACSSLDKIEVKDHKDDREFIDTDIYRIRYCINVNMAPVIEANPDVTFRLLIPPASVARWAEYYNNGEVAFRLDGIEYALSMLTEYDNVIIYGFDDVFELTGDFDRYCDTIHYDAGVSEWIFNEMAAGRHVIDKDNYMEYVDTLRSYYTDYDFTKLNEYIE